MLQDVINAVEKQIELAIMIKGKAPGKLLVNPVTLRSISQTPGFWDDPHFRTQITSTVPIINKFYSTQSEIVLEIIPKDSVFLMTLEE